MMALTLSITLLKFAQKKRNNFAQHLQESVPLKENNAHSPKRIKTANTECLLIKKVKQSKHIATAKNKKNLKL